jgi:hypothetical protein
MSLEERIFQARRTGCLHGLMGGGQTPDVAERWCDAWEREAALEGRPREGEFWEDGMQLDQCPDRGQAVAKCRCVGATVVPVSLSR